KEKMLGWIGLQEKSNKINAELNEGKPIQQVMNGYATGKLGNASSDSVGGISSGYRYGDLSKSYQGNPKGKAEVEGEIIVKFDNAPAGMRAEPSKSNSRVTVSPDVGYSRYAY
ncbi:MAG: hypothetical protein ACRCYN_12585, partial [Plesiomonas sp.]